MKLPIAVLGILASTVAFADEEKPAKIEEITVKGQRYHWLDTPATASEGKVDSVQLKERVTLRPAEVLEAVPGLITTQHSGSGKANQYFLRGFDLDDGTDFSTSVDGIPINMPTHAHGQGYTDVNFLIPEILDSVEYYKGTYNAKVGDFSSAGSVQIKTQEKFPDLIKLSAGTFGYEQVLASGHVDVGTSSSLSTAVQGLRENGPWSDVPENLRKATAITKFTHAGDYGRFHLDALHYQNTWDSTDQIPSRAVQSKVVDRFGAIDKTDGGESKRQSISMDWQVPLKDSELQFQIYAVKYSLNLWSNFTYFLNNPVEGDQFEQEDDRDIYGGQLDYKIQTALGSIPGHTHLGIQYRQDQIAGVGLFQTNARTRWSTTGSNRVRESTTALFLQDNRNWTSKLQSTLGLRYDYASFDNHNKVSNTSADADDDILSPKLSLAYQASDTIQLFASAGQGFHSNDARGVAPAGNSIEAVPALVRSHSSKLGGIWDWNKMLRTSLAAWQLELDSELVFVGDEGGTEASRSSKRHGLDWMLQFVPTPSFHSDIELSWAKARYQHDPDGEGKHVEGAVPFVAALGFGYQLTQELSLSSRFRHFGQRSLTADNSQRSRSTTLVNARLAWENRDWEFAIDALNIGNSDDHDTDYYYESRLSDEAEAVSDIHYHPVEPYMTRVSASYKFPS